MNSAFGSKLLLQASKSIEKHCGTKHCTGCFKHRPVEGGQFIKKSNNGKRWICGHCVEKRKVFKTGA